MKPLLIITIAVVLGIGIGLSINVSAEENLIPSWIKTTAGFWVDGQIDDSEFIKALEYLIDQKIIVVKNQGSIENELKDIEPTDNYQKLTDIKSIKVYVQNLPEYSHNSITMNVVNDALNSWETLNPKLKFEIINKSDDKPVWFYRQNSDISIKWVTAITDPNHLLGRTESTTTTYEGGTTIIQHEILIDLADLDCNGNPIYWDNDTITHTIKHEIGHALGIVDHSSDINNAMFSYSDGKNNINTKGYVIPRTNGEIFYIGEKESADKECFMNSSTKYRPYD
jgi:hypothetical protein